MKSATVKSAAAFGRAFAARAVRGAHYEMSFARFASPSGHIMSAALTIDGCVPRRGGTIAAADCRTYAAANEPTQPLIVRWGQ